MGATAAAAISAGVSAATSMLTAVGLGVGGVFVAAALVALLAAYDVLDAADVDAEVRRTLLVAIVPLLVTFAAVVVYHSLDVLGVAPA